MKNNMLVMEQDGSVITYYFSEKKDKPNLKQLQKMVGGYIQVVELPEIEKQILMDEEGKLKEKPVNPDVTMIAHEHKAIFPTDTINGDAVILSGEARLD